MARRILTITEIDPVNERAALEAFRSKHHGRKVGLVYGPKSREDRYYIEQVPWDKLSISSLLEALSLLGFVVEQLDPTQGEFIRALEKCDFCFINTHGEYGEDGRLQGVLDYLGKPYTGSGVTASAIGMHKVLFKQWLAGVGLPTPRYVDLSSVEDFTTASDLLKTLGLPVIAKPICGGSSIGTHLLKVDEAVHDFFQGSAIQENGPYFAEEFLSGRSLTIANIELGDGLVASPILEAHLLHDFYDEASKAEEGLVTYEIPAKLSDSTAARMTAMALRIHQMLGCSGFSRVDFLLSDDANEITVLEINTIPGYSTNGNFAAALQALGLSYNEMVLAVLRTCLSPKL